MPVRAAGRFVELREPVHVRVPGVVDEPGGVGQQIAQRDVAARGAQIRNAAGAEAVEHLGVREKRQDLPRRLVQLELALLDHLHRGGGGDRLGHRGDAEHAVVGHARGRADVATAER